MFWLTELLLAILRAVKNDDRFSLPHQIHQFLQIDPTLREKPTKTRTTNLALRLLTFSGYLSYDKLPSKLNSQRRQRGHLYYRLTEKGERALAKAQRRVA